MGVLVTLRERGEGGGLPDIECFLLFVGLAWSPLACTMSSVQLLMGSFCVSQSVFGRSRFLLACVGVLLCVIGVSLSLASSAFVMPGVSSPVSSLRCFLFFFRGRNIVSSISGEFRGSRRLRLRQTARLSPQYMLTYVRMCGI